ncbi:MAG: hypothetical protein WC759_04180 [Candidatus Micrarchaeia archaeon]
MAGRARENFREARLDAPTKFGMDYRIGCEFEGFVGMLYVDYGKDPLTTYLRSDPITVREVEAVKAEASGEITVEYLKARRKAQDRERGVEIGKRMAQFREDAKPTAKEEKAGSMSAREFMKRLKEIHREAYSYGRRGSEEFIGNVAITVLSAIGIVCVFVGTTMDAMGAGVPLRQAIGEAVKMVSVIPALGLGVIALFETAFVIRAGSEMVEAKHKAQFRTAAEAQPTKEEEAAYLKKLLRLPELRRNRMPGIIEQKEPKSEKVRHKPPTEGIDPFGIYG